MIHVFTHRKLTFICGYSTFPFTEMDRSHYLSEFECARAQTLLEEGYSQRQVGRILGVSHTTIGRMIRRFRETGQHSRRPGQGRPRSTSELDDRFLRLAALRNRGVTSRELGNLLADVRNVNISGSTVRRKMQESGPAARRPVVTPLLTRAASSFKAGVCTSSYRTLFGRLEKMNCFPMKQR